MPTPKKKTGKSTTKAALNRHKWTEKTLDEIKTIFKKCFTHDVTPGYEMIQKGVERSKKKGGKIWLIDRDRIFKKVSWIRMRGQYKT